MSDEDDTRATLERYTAAWTAGDGATVFASYGEDMVLHYFGQNPFAGTYVGKTDAMAAIREVSRRTKRRLKEIVGVMAGGERGCVIVRETLVKPDGEAVEVERAMLYRVAGGQIRECWVYDQDQAMVDSMINAV